MYILCCRLECDNNITLCYAIFAYWSLLTWEFTSCFLSFILVTGKGFMECMGFNFASFDYEEMNDVLIFIRSESCSKISGTFLHSRPVYYWKFRKVLKVDTEVKRMRLKSSLRILRLCWRNLRIRWSKWMRKWMNWWRNWQNLINWSEFWWRKLQREKLLFQQLCWGEAK